MAQAARDQNFVPTLLGASSSDGTTPVKVYADPSTHRLLVDIPGTTGTVTSVSVVTANGFAGSVADPTSTPAITLSTTLNTPVLAGNGTALIAATTTGSGSTVVLGTAPSISGATITTSIVNGVTLTTGGSASTFLNGAGAYTSPAGGGDVVGPASATDNAVARFDGTTGKLIQNSAVTIADTSGDITAGKYNGLTVTTSTGTLTITNGKVLTVSNTLTFTGTDSSSVAFGAGGTVLYTASTIPLTVGSTTIASGTTTRILYDNAGVLGEYTITGSGTIVAMATAPTFVTSIATPAVLATANDSGALGASGTAFSDLFLASGAVINFNAGNYTLTHSAGILAANSDFRITSANVGTNADSVPTLSSTSTLTNKTLTSPILTTPALGTPASGVLTNCTGTATGLTSGITNALKSATTTVDVSTATAPTSGQVLTATSGTAATWQTPSGGSFIGARVYNSAAQSIGASFAVLTFDTESFDTDTMHDTGSNTGRLTAKTAGYYQIEGTVSTAANAIVLAEIRLNGTTIIAQAGTGNTGAATQGISLSTTYNLSVNDYVEFLGYFGSTQNTQSGLGGTHFTAYKIG